MSVRPGAGREPVEQLRACEVRSREPLSADLFLLRLRPARPVPANAGQFAMIRGRWGDAPLLARPMSLLGAGEELRFLVRRRGAGTARLAALAPGDMVDVLAPLGRGFGAPGARRVVVVAGGCGLAPTLFAARELEASGARPLFLYGARTASELVLRDEVEQTAELRVATDDGSVGHRGPVTDLLAGALAEAPPDAGGEVWCCGPEAMMGAVAAACRPYGARCLVSVEERMACGRGLCLGCARLDRAGTPRYVCVDGPVFDAEDLYGGAGG